MNYYMYCAEEISLGASSGVESLERPYKVPNIGPRRRVTGWPPKETVPESGLVSTVISCTRCGGATQGSFE